MLARALGAVPPNLWPKGSVDPLFYQHHQATTSSPWQPSSCPSPRVPVSENAVPILPRSSAPPFSPHLPPVCLFYLFFLTPLDCQLCYHHQNQALPLTSPRYSPGVTSL